MYDVLEYLASGMTHTEILREFPYLTEADIRARMALIANASWKSRTREASVPPGFLLRLWKFVF